MRGRLSRALSVVTPGLLVAATGVGAGDLATGGIAGSKLGVAVLWAVALGAAMKFLLSENLARWQLATGETVLEGALTRLGPLVRLGFLAYLLPWSFYTGAALMSACGVTAHAIWPALDDPAEARLIFGAAHGLAGLALVWLGGFRAFEKVMGVCIAVMFVSVIATALMLQPDPLAIARGLLVPQMPDFAGEGLIWTIALMGGVGGTLTVICYGYWMREVGRTSPADLRTCRVDLAVGYGATALFGMSMVIIASGIRLDGSGATLVVRLAGQLEAALGPAGRWVFLAGAWAAVFSSLLGVWQSVPYVFTDYVRALRMRRGHGTSGGASPHAVNTRSWTYRGYLLALAALPTIQLARPFQQVQQYYAVVGAAFIPLLAVALLLLNARAAWIGPALRNGAGSTVALLVVLALALAAAWLEVVRGVGG
jgi:Mn2+/Fe2+ NRAMP family transporter